MVSNVTKKIEVDNTPHPPQLSKFLVVKKLGSRRGGERESLEPENRGKKVA